MLEADPLGCVKTSKESRARVIVKIFFFLRCFHSLDYKMNTFTCSALSKSFKDLIGKRSVISDTTLTRLAR